MIDAAGQKVPLSYVADIRSVTGPNTINRENVQRKIVISANVSERDLRGVVMIFVTKWMRASSSGGVSYRVWRPIRERGGS